MARLRAARRILRTLAVILALGALYPAAAVLAALVPVDRGYVAPAAGTPIWLCSNGIHTDLVLPARGGGVDWLGVLPQSLFHVKPDPDGGLSFGWGDRDFYLATPYWSDLKLGVALRAISGGDVTVVHITAQGFPRTDPACRRLSLARATLARLEAYVLGSMATDPRGRPIPIANAGYGANDGFVIGTGHYSPILTCNEWLRRGLARAGLRTALWSPFPFGIRWQSD